MGTAHPTVRALSARRRHAALQHRLPSSAQSSLQMDQFGFCSALSSCNSLSPAIDPRAPDVNG